MNTVCFTGPRAKKLVGFSSHKNYMQVVNAVTMLCDDLYKFGIRRFISGGAQGFDQLAFWGVNNFKKTHPDVKNIVYVPFEGQDRLWMSTGIFSRKEYNQMIEHADEVKIINKFDETKVGKLLNERNIAMVNDSDAVIALFNIKDLETATHSGTANCIRYADSKNKPVVYIEYDVFKNIVRVNDFVTPEDKYDVFSIAKDGKNI